MTIVTPYSFADFADRLNIETVIWDIQRNDESSGTGDGRVWTAELAPPLWLATINLKQCSADQAKQAAARIRKLQGSRLAFFLYDPLSRFPQADPDGARLGQNAVTINSLGADNASLSLAGLPPGYVLTVGDKLSFIFGSSVQRYAFHEISETVTAGSNGKTPEFGIFPNLAVGSATGISVALIKPFCKCVLFPGSHNPGTTGVDHTTTGATFKAIQKK
ncbi:hypothetical protein GR212_15315 [Rhizobium lusitanum]|uniref:Uncharacterized protein n=1 Tax=Rhizobium lusitanum TaxID=293958 RepID=A0A6L9U9G8_9HYPH|nr:hypothetical protein [Rhizobium lusitanum]NEI70952.1 hypothetical protein [Rhizobium lusitanum]